MALHVGTGRGPGHLDRLTASAAAAQVFAPIDPNARLSVNSGFRNGEDHQLGLQGPQLTNLFGTGVNGTTDFTKQVPGAVGVRLRFLPGAYNSVSNSNGLTVSTPIFLSGSSISANRAITLNYYHRGSTSPGVAFANRFVFFCQDCNTNRSGDIDPATGAPGSASPNRGLRSPALDPFMTDSGVFTGVLIHRLNGSKVFETAIIQNGVLTAGDTFDTTPGAVFSGNAAQTNPVKLGQKLNVTSMQAQISGTVLTVNSVNAGSMALGLSVFGAGVLQGTEIVSLGTGTTGVGTYNINYPQTVAAETMTFSTTADFFSGAISDFVQLAGTGAGASFTDGGGTDAEWIRFEQGESPVAIWGSRLAAWYRLRGTGDLTQTGGARAYAAMSFIGSGQSTGTMLAATAGTVTAANSLLAIPLYQGFGHPLDPADVLAARGGGLAAIRALTSTVSRDIYIGGAATHVQARAVRTSDDLVVTDWTRCTSVAGTGVVATLLPGVIVGEHRIEYRREDDNACVSIAKDQERVGIGIAANSQSQFTIAMDSNVATTLTGPGANNMVSYGIARGAGGLYLPFDGGLLTTKHQMSDALLACAQWYNGLNTGVPIFFDMLTQVGTLTTDWIYQSLVDGQNLAGDGVSKTSGYATTVLLARRKRMTITPVSWWTSDEATSAGGSVTIASTPFGARTITERPWEERMNEWFGGVPKVGAGAPEIAERTNLVKLGLLTFKPWLLMFPQSRSRDNTNVNATNSDVDTAFRKKQYDYGLTNTGMNTATMFGSLGGWQMAVKMPVAGTVHQDETDARGNINFLLSIFQGVAAATGLWNADINPRFSTASGVGTGTLTLPATLTNGGSLMTAVVAATPQDFEVSEAGGAWSRMGGAIPFTPAISGNSITLLRGSGPWNANTRVRYLWGWPNAVGLGGDAAEDTMMGGNLYESKAGAAPVLVGPVNANMLVAGLPLAPSLTVIQAT